MEQNKPLEYLGNIVQNYNDEDNKDAKFMFLHRMIGFVSALEVLLGENSEATKKGKAIVDKINKQFISEAGTFTLNKLTTQSDSFYRELEEDGKVENHKEVKIFLDNLVKYLEDSGGAVDGLSYTDKKTKLKSAEMNQILGIQ